MKRIIVWLLVTTAFGSLVWTLFVPLWHFPDEQAHFGHVAYLAEGNRGEMGRTNDLNQEIAISEQRLGTYRNKYGNNDFTFHPEYRLAYSETDEGIYEAEIKNLPLSSRKEFKDPESAYYPHFFYRVSALIYNLFYYQDIFERAFALRIFWLWAHLLMVYLAYLIGKEIFPKDRLAAVSVAVLTGSQPMLTFASAGITSDNLHNLLFTAVIYFCLKLSRRLDWPNLFGLAGVVAFGFINKPQFLIALGIIVPLIFLKAIKQKQFKLLAVFGGIVAAIAFIFGKDYLLGIRNSLLIGEVPFIGPIGGLVRPDYNLWQHLIYTAKHTFREVLPWYWGVFRWLSLTLPRWVNQVMMRILLVAGIGLVIKFWRKKFEPGFGIIVWSALIYFLALFFWDFQQVRNAGFPFGMQGRYYFPVIVPHMVLLVIGVQTIWRKLLLPLNYWFIALNWIAFYWVTASYYDASGFKTFIIQASQYKPDFAKGWWLVTVLFLYAALTLMFSIKLLKHEK